MAASLMPGIDLANEDIEIELLVRAMQLKHGHDFSQYAPASLKRRIVQLSHSQGSRTISGLIERVLYEPGFMSIVLEGLSVPVSEMFRDPPVFRALRDQVIPLLASYAQVNIWIAGCAHGQEVYSLAILLEEAGIYDRCQIYATDFNDAALWQAQEAIYPAREAQLWSRNYTAAGGEHTLADYYSARYELIKLDERLRRHVTFANHNLVTDDVFCEAHLVMCRNVLIYFGDALQDRALGLFRDSLRRGGFLCLGSRESIDFAPSARGFAPVDSNLRIYQLASKP